MGEATDTSGTGTASAEASEPAAGDTRAGGSPAQAGPAEAGGRSLGHGPGRLLLTVYGVFLVAAGSRSLFQLLAQFDRAPLAYVLSAVSAVVYLFITVTLVRGGENARRAALAACVLELVGVLGVGTWTVADPAAFPDSTVWSFYGMDYLFIPLVLPVTALVWLRRAGGRTTADR